MEIGRANTEHLTAAEIEEQIPVADHRRRPISISRLAERLNMPGETVRRRVAILEGAGFCSRTPQGVTVFGAALSRPGVLGLVSQNAADVQRLFTRLDRLGVIASWEADRALPRPASPDAGDQAAR
jgi:predicted transcriptional regulator